MVVVRMLVVGVAVAGFAAHAHAQPPRADRPLAVGYTRGMGLGNVGMDAVYWLGPLSLGGAAFVLADNNIGFALAPRAQLNLNLITKSTTARETLAVFIAAGPQYIRRSFGNVAAKGFGGYAAFGVQIPLPYWLQLSVAINFNAQGEISGRNDNISVSQPAVVGPAIDTSLRYRF